MCNKYEHELTEDSIVKRYADIITEFETVKKIPFDSLDDFEDDVDTDKGDIVDEDSIFLAHASPQCPKDNVNNMNKYEVREKAKERIYNVNAKISKISIAPGEFGNL